MKTNNDVIFTRSNKLEVITQVLSANNHHKKK